MIVEFRIRIHVGCETDQSETLCKVGSGSVPVENNFGAQHLVAVSSCTVQ